MRKPFSWKTLVCPQEVADLMDAAPEAEQKELRDRVNEAVRMARLGGEDLLVRCKFRGLDLVLNARTKDKPTMLTRELFNKVLDELHLRVKGA